MTLTLERPAVPTRRRIDADEYRRMGEALILTPDERVELIEGEIIAMPPIGDAHAFTVIELNRAMAPAVVAGAVVVAVQSPLRLDPFNVPQPDLLLLRPPSGAYRSRPPGPADVLLLIEVADSSLAYDRTTKLPLYARHAIPEVWLLDLAAGALELHRAPAGGAYGTLERLTAGRATALLVPGLAVDVAAILG